MSRYVMLLIVTLFTVYYYGDYTGGDGWECRIHELTQHFDGRPEAGDAFGDTYRDGGGY